MNSWPAEVVSKMPREKELLVRGQVLYCVVPVAVAWSRVLFRLSRVAWKVEASQRYVGAEKTGPSSGQGLYARAIEKERGVRTSWEDCMMGRMDDSWRRHNARVSMDCHWKKAEGIVHLLYSRIDSNHPSMRIDSCIPVATGRGVHTWWSIISLGDERGLIITAYS